jgi:thiamine-monophosphate kinase
MKAIPALAAGLKVDPLTLALDGGEDYELLFTVPPRNERRLRQAPGFRDLPQIGEIVRGRQVTLIQKDGSEKRLAPGGWDPFHGKPVGKTK